MRYTKIEAYFLLVRERRSWTLLIISIPILAVLITWLTGFWTPYSIYESGFPFSWETRECVAILSIQGGFSCTPIAYNWTLFLLDLAIYSAIGYSILFGYTATRPLAPREPASSGEKLESTGHAPEKLTA